MNSTQLSDAKEQGFNVKEESLADLDSFLDTQFEEFQGFPWSTLELGSASQAQPATSEPPILPYAFEFPQSAPSSGPLEWASQSRPADVPQQHRLLKPDGFAFSLPDLTTAGSALDGTRLYDFGGAMAPASTPLSPRTSADGAELLPRQQSTVQSEASPDAGTSTGEHRGKATIPLSERNKQAQRRHRQRQRERMDTLENQVKRLTDEKQALTAEKAALAGQAAVLTQVLQMRDEQLNQMQQAHHQSNMSSSPLAIVKAEPDDDATPRESAVSNGLAESLAEVLTLTVRDDQEIHLQPSQVKAMTPQEVARLWAEYMSALMKQLQAAQGGVAEAALTAEARISALLREVLVLLMRYALCDLIKMKQFVAGKVKNPAQSQLENSEMWRSAAHNLQLTESQRKALVQLRLLFMQKQDLLIAQRRAAMAALQSTIPSCASSHDIAAQFLRAEAAMSRLHENLRMENQLIVDLIYTLFVKVSTPVQAARCLVQSFPAYPDSLAIITWVAAEAGDASAMELLQRPAQRHQSEQSSAGTVSS